MNDNEFVTVNQLLDFGIPRGQFWNTGNRDLPIERDDMIVNGLSRGYNERIINLFIDFFGADEVHEAFKKAWMNWEISQEFYLAVLKEVKKRKGDAKSD